MAQQAFFTVSLPAVASNLYVKVGFIPGLIELTNLTRTIAGGVSGVGTQAMWQNGMVAGSSINTVYNAGLASATAYNATNGITLLGLPGTEQGQYGAIVSAFSNANPGIITVDSTFNQAITAGCIIRVSNVADNQAGTNGIGLNGDYYVASVTPTTITLGTAPVGLWTRTVLSGPSTTTASVYISGGFVTLLQNANATIPNPPYNINSNVPTFYNSAIQGFIIGVNTFPGAVYSAVTPDIILVAAFDLMTP